MRRAAVQRLCLQPRQQLHQRRKRVLRPVGIGRVALHALHGDVAGQRSATADLHHLAHFVRAGGFSHQAMGHPLAVEGHPVQDGNRPILALAFLVAGDGDDHRPVRGRVAHEVHRRRDEGRNPRLHVAGTAAIHEPIPDLGAEGIEPPGFGVAHRHHIGMPVEAKGPVRALLSPAGVKIGDPVAVHAGAGESRLRQEAFQKGDRSTLGRSDRRAADQLCSQFHRVYGLEGHHQFQIGACMIRSRLGRGLQPQGVWRAEVTGVRRRTRISRRWGVSRKRA